mmetsp:Transcript_12014/g.21300  ORF Transcript_12014/g.21300 Transcript_12014/m.21300 type:complete len:238 (-) Transcript_12014:57-770(-)
MAWAPPPRAGSGGSQARHAGGRSTPTLSRPPTNGSMPSRPSVGSVGRSSSPQRLSVAASGVDDKSIITLSQLCTEDLDAKLREKNDLIKLMNDLKKSKTQYDIRIAKKKKEFDQTTVQTMEMDKRLGATTNSNRVSSAEVAGLMGENSRLKQDVETLRANLTEAIAAYERECEEIEGLKQALQQTRKDLGAETRTRDMVQQDLRASRTAQTLMINRLDDIERRSRVLKNTVANTINN